MFTKLGVGLIVSFGLMATACSGASTTRAVAERPPGAAPAAAAALRFTAETVAGEDFDGESLAGKHVVFWFWSPYCASCAAEAPAVRSAIARYAPRGVTFVGVGGRDDRESMAGFVKRTDTADVTHIADEQGEVRQRLGVAGDSTFVFVKPDGSLTRVSGPLVITTLAAHVDKLLKQ
ncbi:TlpA family protein disulfide reductase [Rhizohabitans arisaemae]|uniref:TlpA family protein disulfide reductase n=1 Tax=Rhizohabitans arisaemae TaxID=2720610 RepID=UPI0024B22E4B|nr:redoxin domain-containing protein [Rhizohabitans arisaemae]